MKIKRSLQLAIFGFVTCLSTGFLASKTLAQQSNIIPDNTLGRENSRVNSNIDISGINSDKIEGGARRNINLFHSFQEFNIDGGRGAYFLSSDSAISNIISRVTGGNV
ncbi:MAG: filamentous hemagglutinin, partial [Cyanobacteria bacterium J06636_27]